MTTANRKVLFWSICIFLLCWFFYSVRAILLPFVIGILIGYFLNPPAIFLMRKGLKRGIASALLVISFFASLTMIIIFLGPILVDQLQSMAEHIPQYINRFNAEVVPYIEKQLQRIDPQIALKAHQEAQKQSSDIALFFGKILGNIWSSSLWLFHLASLILLTPVVAFYMLRDWDKFLKKTDSLLPREYAKTIREQAKKIDITIASYLRGQINVCLLLGFYYGIALSIIGLDFGLLIGFLTGLLSFIPYVGMLVGASIALGVAFFQFGADDLTHLVFVASIFGAGSVLDGSILSPKIVGDKIGVHPTWLIFGMLSGGALLGLLGVIIAVPITAIIGVLVKFAVEQYGKSEFYVAPPKIKAKKS